MIKILISPACADDVPDLIEIQTECGLSQWTSDGYNSEMERLDSVILLAREAHGQPIGFIAGRVIDKAHPPEAEVYNIGIVPLYQNRGFGTQLLSEFIEICRPQGVTAIWLEVRASNINAITFYRARNFVGQDRRRSFYSNPTEDAEVMSLQL